MLKSVKAAPAPSGDRLEFIMSDSSIDRMGDVIEAKGWDLKNFRSHPIALFNHDRDQVIGKWADVRIDGNRLVGRLELADAGTSPLVDTVRALVDQNILRAVSVGFQPIEKQPLTDDADKYFGPFRFTKSELLECSLVAVPANAHALSTVKALGNFSSDVLAEIFRKPAATPAANINAKPGKHLAPTGTKMKTLSQRIEDNQTHLNDYRDLLSALANQDERNESEEAQYLELPQLIEREQNSLAANQAAERAMATHKAIVVASPSAPAVIKSHPVMLAKPREHIVRAMSVHCIAKMTGAPIDQVLRDRYPNDEGTSMVLRAAMAPATTTTASWGAELVGTAIADFMDQLSIVSIYPRVAAKGSKFTFGRNGVVKVPARSTTPKINGSFVGEGQAIPVRKLGLAAITLTPKKMAVISEFTREMSLHSTPAIESVIRQAINEDTAEAIDQVLIDTVAADTIRPAGLRNGVGGLTPSAASTTFDKIVADIKALMGAIIAVRGGRDLVLLCNPAQELGMAWAVAPNGTFVFADNEAAQMRRITVIASTTVAAGLLIMLDAADFASATGDAPEFDVSDVATIHEEDTAPLPIVGGTATPPLIASVAAPVRSLWQTASIGIRMLLDMNWTMRRTGMVAWMTGVTW